MIKKSVNIDLTTFEQDVSAVLFFKNIYNKSDYYFKLVRSSISSSLTKLILNLDTQILILEEQEKKMKELKQLGEESEKKAKNLAEEIAQIKQKEKEYQDLLAKSEETHKKQWGELDTKFKAKDQDINKLTEQLTKLKD